MTRKKSSKETEEKCPACNGCGHVIRPAPKTPPAFDDREHRVATFEGPPLEAPGPPFSSADGRRMPEGMPRFSLRKLRDVQWRLEQVWRGARGVEGPAFVHPFTDEQLAIMSHAIGVLAAERLAAGERLTEADDAQSRADAETWPKASTAPAPGGFELRGFSPAPGGAWERIAHPGDAVEASKVERLVAQAAAAGGACDACKRDRCDCYDRECEKCHSPGSRNCIRAAKVKP